jgi:hypothetical protein
MPPPQAPRCSCTLHSKQPRKDSDIVDYVFDCHWDKGDTTPNYSVFVEARSDREALRLAIENCPYESSKPTKDR